MPISFTTLKEQAAMPMYTLKERTYLDSDGQATTNPEKAQTLLGAEGDEILEQQAVDAGLLKSADAEPAAEAAQPEMLYYDAQGNRVEQGSEEAAQQFLSNDPNRPDVPKPGEAEAGPSLKSMKKAELQALAEERGMEVADGATRAELIEALEKE